MYYYWKRENNGVDDWQWADSYSGIFIFHAFNPYCIYIACQVEGRAILPKPIRILRIDQDSLQATSYTKQRVRILDSHKTIFTSLDFSNKCSSKLPSSGQKKSPQNEF